MSAAVRERAAARRRALRGVCLATLTLVGCETVARGPSVPRRFVGHVGERRLLDGAWEDADKQRAGGVVVDWTPEDASWGYELGLFGSAEEDEPGVIESFDSLGNPFSATAEISASAFDVHAGVRKTVHNPVTGSHLYVAAGLAYVYVEREGESPTDKVDDSDGSLGVYGRAGVYWHLETGYVLGLDYRVLGGTDVDIRGVDDADSALFSVFVGTVF